MRLLAVLCLIWVVDFSVNTGLWLVFHPLADEELVFRVVEVTALTFAHIANPVTFEVVAVTLGENTITITFSFVPLAFVDILICIDHTTFALR